MSNQPFKIFSGTKSKYMALEIAKNLGVELGQMNIQRFADGEFQVSYEESVRGDEVYLVQSTFPNSDNLMELLLMVDAAKRASAKSVTAVIPYFGWARQDRKDKPRVSIAAKLVASMLTAAGVDSIITMDLHADQIQGFFDLPLNHLLASSVFIPYIKKLKLKDMVIASPDVGGVKRVNSYAKYFNVPLVMCHKQRARANVVEKMTIIGDVQDKNVILIDDMIDTAGTICTAAQVMMDNGAKSVRAIASHAIMSDPATERINKSALEEVVFTNSIPYDTSRSDKVKIISVAGLIADTIERIHQHESISSQYLV
ncbi:MAG: ribose-phosphate pyrophosphokinase [Muribaculaceae bacterium]|nr:ribose-phosphate pyrophosphokinase [Muribaculaceae bacterium]MBQ2562632.1 ribose-phosphate pyrophosphokinase [Muribaculaceae bacterium]MDY6293563.1 ribose-phosphate pyrophosphokinase [Bacteroidales bacterium]MDY6412340.1 ribose-phosphate pyrophosphokinase [Bacteroidales bacterium]